MNEDHPHNTKRRPFKNSPSEENFNYEKREASVRGCCHGEAGGEITRNGISFM